MRTAKEMRMERTQEGNGMAAVMLVEIRYLLTVDRRCVPPPHNKGVLMQIPCLPASERCRAAT